MKAVSTRKFLWIGTICIVTAIIITVAAVSIFFWVNNKHDSNKPQTITGKVTAISNQCNVDGICSVTLDSTKTIITGCGLQPDGRTCKVYDQSKLHNGQLVEAVIMRSDATTYNLDCDSCTIRVLN